jgi:hypothetical protein
MSGNPNKTGQKDDQQRRDASADQPGKQPREQSAQQAAEKASVGPGEGEAGKPDKREFPL